MTKELIEQEKSKEEVFKDAIIYIESFRNIVHCINNFEICFDPIINKKRRGLPYFGVVLEVFYVANALGYPKAERECGFNDLLVKITSKERNEALENFEVLKRKYGLDFLNKVLPKRYSVEKFEGLVKMFDSLHSKLAEHIAYPKLESKVKTAV